MPYKLGVLVIHGMGSQEADFVTPMEVELKRRVGALGGDPDEICFCPAWWAPVLRERQTDLLRRMQHENELDWMKMRRFVVHALADAIAYQDTADRAVTERIASTSPLAAASQIAAAGPGAAAGQINVYQQVHVEIGKAMATLRQHIRDSAGDDAPEAPLVVIAHSLGCHMISNYIWDVRDSPEANPPENPFVGFRTLTSIVMMGCNIPLFTLAYTNLQPIRFPTPGLSPYFPAGTPAEAIVRVSKWLNFYDPDDVLGYPLRSLGDTFRERVSEDVAVNAGGPLSTWNPLSHNQYWTDDDVTRPVARLLHGILELLR
ncbi:MAG TPA: hypothetical protein VHG08_02925 [Longimicrobium sp.]|nr:hypothetical protein [Longimicrobium sp.]